MFGIGTGIQRSAPVSTKLPASRPDFIVASLNVATTYSSDGTQTNVLIRNIVSRKTGLQNPVTVIFKYSGVSSNVDS